jgi:D-alanyl-D-alanine carboxypeptidase
MRRLAPAILAISVALCAPRLADARGREEAVAAGFTFTKRDLPELAKGAPAETRKMLLASPRRFLDLLQRVMDGPPDLVALVDKKIGLPRDFEPPDLVSLARLSIPVSRTDFRLRTLAVPPLRAMIEEAKKDGVHLVVASAFRSFEYQERLYARSVASIGREQTDRELARPGHSQHQLGTAMDFGSIDLAFAETAEGRWLFANASRFGFCLSFPQGGENETGYMFEPWHYRYVGRDAAALIDAYFPARQHAFLSWYNERIAFLRVHRRR